MKTLVRSLSVLGGMALLALALPASTVGASSSQHGDVHAFNTAFANVAPFLGTAGAIRGINAAGLPWAIESIRGDLDSSGQLSVRVRGLVLADDPSVPVSLRGVNPVPSFAAIVSCASAVAGKQAVVNVTSANFAASSEGDAVISQKLALPTPCAAPDVFITSPNGGAWFAVTGSAASQGRTELAFHTAFANVTPFIGAAGTITGVPAAGLPWAIDEIDGTLRASGQLDVDVEGLVLANDPSVPANLRGVNPVPSFAAVVTCRTNVNGAVAAVRATSANFPATSTGNAQIHAMLNLAAPCATPYVFITSPNGGVWFAVTGV